jgi:predicted PurR-regulated permease PerM
MEFPRSITVPIWILALLTLLSALTAASEIVVPLLLATLLALTLAPAVRALIALRLPRALAALIVVSVALLLATAVFYVLAEPAQAWIERAPAAMRRLEFGMRALLKPLQAASQATESLMNIGSEETQTVVATSATSPASLLVSLAPALLASVLATVFLTFLFLLHGDTLLRKFVAIVPGLSAKKELVAGTREAQHELSLYLLTISAINAALGAATAGVLYALGVEDALLWGGVAGVLNYAPYVGAIVTGLLLLVVGFAQYTDPWQALAVPGAFVALNLVEAYLVTPLLLGKRLALDPVVIFIALMLFGYLWGMTGMLIAVPLLACLRIVAQRVEHGDAVARLLGELPRPEPDDDAVPDPLPPEPPPPAA